MYYWAAEKALFCSYTVNGNSQLLVGITYSKLMPTDSVKDALLHLVDSMIILKWGGTI
jgi:hypothetical protein